MPKIPARPESSFTEELAPETAYLFAIVGGTVLLFLFPLVYALPIQVVLRESGFFAWFYGVDASDAAASTKLMQIRQGLWVTALATPLQVVAVLLLLLFVLHIPFETVGLTLQSFRRNAVAGLLFAAIFLPGALGINFVASSLLKLAGSAPQEHTFTQLGQAGLHPVEWGLLIFAAVIAAPIWEELFFRGMVQSWVLAQPRGGGLGVFGVSALLAFGTVTGARVMEQGPIELLVKFSPVWVLALFAAGFLGLVARQPRWGALLAVAVAFGWVHVHVWPTPVPLVWLGLGLGWLRWQGQSLVGPVVLHGVFNAFSCALLLFSSEV